MGAGPEHERDRQLERLQEDSRRFGLGSLRGLVQLLEPARRVAGSLFYTTEGPRSPQLRPKTGIAAPLIALLEAEHRNSTTSASASGGTHRL